MTQELSPEAPQPAAQEDATLRPGFLAWLGRRAAALQPRSRRHWALYALLFLLALFLLFEWRSATTFPAQVLVTAEEGNVVGISPYDPDQLDFGDLPRGGGATLTVNLENGSPIPMGISIVATGDIRQFIQISDAFFVLKPGETKEVGFTTGIPGSAQPEKYSGKVYVFRTPWIPWP